MSLFISSKTLSGGTSFSFHLASSAQRMSFNWCSLGAVHAILHGYAVSKYQIIVHASAAVLPTPCPDLMLIRSSLGRHLRYSSCQSSSSSMPNASSTNSLASFFHSRSFALIWFRAFFWFGVIVKRLVSYPYLECDTLSIYHIYVNYGPGIFGERFFLKATLTHVICEVRRWRHR